MLFHESLPTPALSGSGLKGWKHPPLPLSFAWRKKYFPSDALKNQPSKHPAPLFKMIHTFYQVYSGYVKREKCSIEFTKTNAGQSAKRC
jgi:hypothetical protein